MASRGPGTESTGTRNQALKRSELRQRLAAILVADVAGYSRLMAIDERATVIALDRARNIVRAQVESNFGRVIDMAGDSALVLFETATGAVQAALGIQKETAAASSALPEDRRMRYRIGVHLGDVMLKPDGSIYGDGVNIAARLEALASPGGIMISDGVRGAVRGKVAADFIDQGEQQVKNIDHPVRAYALVAGGSPRPAPSPAPATLALPDRPSIAVLPFANISGDPQQEYFADGMVEDIITELSRFQRLFVIARNTSFTYKGRSVDVKKVAQELGVHFVLEGSVRKAGDRVRVTAQLINGDTGQHVWAERYEDVLSDVFELQERITRQVVASMVPEIESEEMRLLERGKRRYSEADDIAWRAVKTLADGEFQGRPALVDEAIRLAEQSVAGNSACQQAWAVLASAHCWRVFLAWSHDRKADLAAGRRAADVLMQLAPNDSRSYYLRGVVESLTGEFNASVADLRRAQVLNPNDAPAQFFLSHLESSDGQIERAKALAAQATRLSPKDRWVSTAHLAMAACAFIEGDLKALHDWSALAIQSQPSHPFRRVLMIAYAAQAGDEALLHANIEKLQSFAPDFIPSLFRGETVPFRRPQDMEALFAILRKAGLHGQPLR
jgi:adenylate cyclase